MRSSSATITQLATSEEPPYDRNGVVSPVSGIRLGDAADDDEHLQRDRPPARPVASSLPKPSRQTSAARSAALDDQAVEQDHRDHAGQAELLADRAEDEVGLGEGDPLRACPGRARGR